MDEDNKPSDRKEIAAQGGRARAAKIPPEQRSEIARNAAQQRWSGHVHHALEEGPLDLVGMTFRCAVLDNEVLVITGTEFMRTMGIYRSGATPPRAAS